ncbi:MAG: type II toxin-antitoxin system RelE/ParE family toxin [Methylococcaceae bacterium]
MKRLSTKWFKKWSKKVGLTNQYLLEAIKNLEDGLSTTDIGSHLFKVRVKREHSGKSSGFRTIIIYQKNDKAIFLYGFGKNEKSNIDKAELQYFKKLGNDLLALNLAQLEQFLEQKVLFDLEEVE